MTSDELLAGKAPGVEPPPAEATESAGTATTDASILNGEPVPGMPTKPASDVPMISSNAVRPVVGLIANVTVVTALLVYFGWRRTETVAWQLGFDESILDMSTQDYVLRSVGPVLVLLLGIAVIGLGWLWIERPLRKWFAVHASTRAARVARAGLLLAWLLLPLAVIGIGYLWRKGAYVLFPVSIGVGVLLAYYASRRTITDGVTSERHTRIKFGLVGVLIAVCLFWTASNYAEVLGVAIAQEFSSDLERATGVIAYSKHRLHLEAPGTVEVMLPEEEGAFRYRYSGLRLLQHTGGSYFLLSDGWSPRYGVVIELPDDDDTIRLQFVRDRR